MVVISFLISVFFFGTADVNDNWHIHVGRDLSSRNYDRAIAVEFTQDF